MGVILTIHADDTLTLMADSERKLHELLDRPVKESEKMKANSTSIEKSVRNWKYLGRVFTEVRKRDSEIRKRIGLVKEALQKVWKAQRNRKKNR